MYICIRMFMHAHMRAPMYNIDNYIKRKDKMNHIHKFLY